MTFKQSALLECVPWQGVGLDGLEGPFQPKLLQLCGSVCFARCAVVGFHSAALPSSPMVPFEAFPSHSGKMSAMGQPPKGDVGHPVWGSSGSA